MEKHNLDAMLRVARAARAEAVTHVEFMMHSSELMPGASPARPTAAVEVSAAPCRLEMLFEELSAWCRGMTLREFHAWFAKSAAPRMAST